MKQIANIRCAHVLAQVTLGFYDEEGNLLREETFPQSDGNLLTAKIFYPHAEQLTNLIGMCIDQARAKMGAALPPESSAPEPTLPGEIGTTQPGRTDEARTVVATSRNSK